MPYRKDAQLFFNRPPAEKGVIFKIEPGAPVDPFLPDYISIDNPVNLRCSSPAVSRHLRIHAFPYLTGVESLSHG